MSDYRFQIVRVHDIDCLHVMIDGEEIAHAHIPLDAIQTAMHRYGAKQVLPGVSRIKISAGSQIKMDGPYTASFPAPLNITHITDADTGQCFSCFSGMEIITDIKQGNRVKLVLDEDNFELDYHVKQGQTDKWNAKDTKNAILNLESEIDNIAQWTQTLRFKIDQMRSEQAEHTENASASEKNEE